MLLAQLQLGETCRSDPVDFYLRLHVYIYAFFCEFDLISKLLYGKTNMI